MRVNTLRGIRYSIRLGETGGGQTGAEWRHVITGLSEEGNSFVQRTDEAAFQVRMVEIENRLNHYLETARVRPRRGLGGAGFEQRAGNLIVSRYSSDSASRSARSFFRPTVRLLITKFI